jgi:ATP-binding cassette, subfamily B, bacterial
MKFPIYIQPDAMDCGPTSLKMIVKYYGKNISIDKLRSLTYTVKDGKKQEKEN